MQILRYKAKEFLGRYVFTEFRRSISILEPEKSPFLMVASIGNPEPQYQGTRHNVAHWALEELVKNHWMHFKKFQTHKNISEGVYSTSNTDVLSNVFLFKSTNSFMNLQGDPISKTWNKVRDFQKHNHSPALVVIHDDLQVPLGKFQIRKQRTSARGHNGLRSIDSLVGGGYTKISIGIGKSSKNVSNYVLSPFTYEELEALTYDVMPKIATELQDMATGKHVYDVQDTDPNSQHQKKKNRLNK